MVMAVVRGLVADEDDYLIEVRRADGACTVADLHENFIMCNGYYWLLSSLHNLKVPYL